MRINENYIISSIECQIETGLAKPIDVASFTQGDEGEIRTTFYTLWGSVIRVVYNRSSTIREFFFVKGEDLEIFEAHYRL